MKYTLINGHPRGFLSTYITILTSLKDLLSKNVKIEDIFVDNNIFYLYGNYENWFNYSRSTNSIIGEGYNTISSHRTDLWNQEELAKSKAMGLPYNLLNEYRKYFPLNDRICDKINKVSNNFDNCLGIHYRGTDHQGFHTIPVSIQIFLTMIEKSLCNEKYDSIFIASDEQDSLDKIINFICGKFNIKILYNDCFRSKDKNSIHFTQKTAEDMIKSGDDVLMDATCLSKCKKIIARQSNIINYAWILNDKLNVFYLDGVFKHV
jgi:hypothetical protein